MMRRVSSTGLIAAELALALLLFVLAWPSFVAGLALSRADPYLFRIRAEGTAPAVDLIAADELLTHAAAARPTARILTDRGLVRLLRAEDKDLPQTAREPLYRAALDDVERGLARSPASTYAWFRLAVLRRATGAPAGTIVQAIETSIATGPQTPQIETSRLRLALRYWPQLAPQTRDLLEQRLLFIARHKPVVLVNEVAYSGPPYAMALKILETRDAGLARQYRRDSWERLQFYLKNGR